MRRQLVIIGNSGAARECYWIARDIICQGADFSFKGFLAFEGYLGDLKELSDTFLCSDEAYRPMPEDVFAIGIGTPDLRLKAYEKWKARGVSFVTLAHPLAKIHENTELGEANIIVQDAAFSCNVSIGNANFINGGVIFGHDVIVGDGNVFAPRSMILGCASVGSGNMFGAQSVVLPQAAIGSNNTVAPGAFLYKGCRDGCVMAGNPAFSL